MGCGLVVGSSRLFAAADFLLETIQTRSAMRAIPAMIGGPEAESPPFTRSFTRHELTEALSMLIRMGLAPPSNLAPESDCGLLP